jgi:hypothetical protein
MREKRTLETEADFEGAVLGAQAAKVKKAKGTKTNKIFFFIGQPSLKEARLSIPKADGHSRLKALDCDSHPIGA